jgi:hypothetical protein
MLKNAFWGQLLFDIYHFMVVTPASNFKSSFFQWVIFFSEILSSKDLTSNFSPLMFVIFL